MTDALHPGSPAPDFDLPADGGGRARLKDYAGRAVVLYFYPKDDTAGCTKEAADFTDQAQAFAAAGAVVIGVSKDSVANHDKFKAKYGLAPVLASDVDGAMIQCTAPGCKRACTAGPIWASIARPSSSTARVSSAAPGAR